MSGQHALLAPSSAPVWGFCSGSVQLQAARPDYETPEQAEGTAAHWVCSEVLDSYRRVGAAPLLCGDMVGRDAPNGVPITPEMAECAEIFVRDVLAVVQDHGAARQMLVEHRVEMPAIHKHNWGTLDCGLVLRDAGVIYLWDYKHGHRENSAIENLQLIDYVAGLVQEYELDGFADQYTEVVMRIVQPRCYQADGPISEWRVKLSDLRGWFNHLEHAANMAVTNPRLTTGLHCRDCNAVSTCPAARKAAYSMIDYLDQPFAADTMTGDHLATEWLLLQRGLKAAKARLDTIEEDLRYRVSQGDTSTGLAIESSPGRVAWTVPVAQAVALAAQFGVDAAKPGVLTPTQTVSAAPAAVRPLIEATLKGVTKRPEGSTKLVPAAGSKIAAAFTPKKPQEG